VPVDQPQPLGATIMAKKSIAVSNKIDPMGDFEQASLEIIKARAITALIANVDTLFNNTLSIKLCGDIAIDHLDSAEKHLRSLYNAATSTRAANNG
jgi:hypothetical protein